MKPQVWLPVDFVARWCDPRDPSVLNKSSGDPSFAEMSRPGVHGAADTILRRAGHDLYQVVARVIFRSSMIWMARTHRNRIYCDGRSSPERSVPSSCRTSVTTTVSHRCRRRGPFAYLEAGDALENAQAMAAH